jgi:hypothetical protein
VSVGLDTIAVWLGLPAQAVARNSLGDPLYISSGWRSPSDIDYSLEIGLEERPPRLAFVVPEIVRLATLNEDEDLLQTLLVLSSTNYRMPMGALSLDRGSSSVVLWLTHLTEHTPLSAEVVRALAQVVIQTVEEQAPGLRSSLRTG